MRAPAFWWQPGATATARMLAPLAALYGAVAARRMAKGGVRAAIPVICAGNLVAGGAGKTPLVQALTALLVDRGYRPAVLSRGHGGRLHGPVFVDPARHDAGDVGDEPLMLAADGPVVVSRDRPAGAAFAAGQGADVVVMDDGLQNPFLAKDLSLAVVDAAVGIGNGRVIPAGPLRAPLQAQWPKIHGLVLVGRGDPGLAVAEQAARAGIVTIAARLVPDPDAADWLRGRRVLAVAGIGRPTKFFETLEEIGAVVAATRAFPDHHRFSAADLDELASAAAAQNLIVATTQKDAARLPAALPSGLQARLAILPVRLVLDDPRALERLFAEAGLSGFARP